MTADPADLAHACAALEQALAVLRRHAAAERMVWRQKPEGPVTDADHEVDALLRRLLPRPGEAWLSEETIDDPVRLRCRRVWVVDPLDGTRAFVARRPEYSTSIALVEDGVPVLGAIGNPATGVSVWGGPGLGVQVQGDPTLAWPATADAGGLRVLGSRSEWRRGEWQHLEHRPGVRFLPCGSVAWKLALVAAGAADATWTLQPKNEWDVAAGAALVVASGGAVWLPAGGPPRWNQPVPRFPGFAAARADHRADALAVLASAAS